MTLTPATIKPAVGSKYSSKRLGRGNGSGKGTTAARGGKGQTARSGGGKRTQIRAFKHQLLKVPKLRGFKSQYAKDETVTLRTLEILFSAGDRINPKVLKERGLISGKEGKVKILGSGELTKKLVFQGCLATKKAMEAIEKAGGKLVY